MLSDISLLFLIKVIIDFSFRYVINRADSEVGKQTVVKAV